jgi:hypothetical protein
VDISDATTISSDAQPPQVSTPMARVNMANAANAIARGRPAPSVTAEVAVRLALSTLSAAATLAPIRKLLSAHAMPAMPERNRRLRSQVHARATTLRARAPRPVAWMSNAFDMATMSPRWVRRPPGKWFGVCLEV